RAERRQLRLARFVFSGRRRHTRCYRDWSSDVCSSDLFVLRELRGLSYKEIAEDLGDLLVGKAAQLAQHEGASLVGGHRRQCVGEIGRASCREGGWQSGVARGCGGSEEGKHELWGVLHG